MPPPKFPAPLRAMHGPCHYHNQPLVQSRLSGRKGCLHEISRRTDYTTNLEAAPPFSTFSHTVLLLRVSPPIPYLALCHKTHNSYQCSRLRSDTAINLRPPRLLRMYSEFQGAGYGLRPMELKSMSLLYQECHEERSAMFMLPIATNQNLDQIV